MIGDGENGDDAKVCTSMWSGIIKGLVEGFESEIVMGVLSVGYLRWWNLRQKRIFLTSLGRRLIAWN